jgi:hypothetical protein
MLRRVTSLVFIAALPGAALAHASEQAFVLLLPTAAYIAGGVAAVTLTVVAMALIPADRARAMFRSAALPWRWPGRGRYATSLASFAFLAALLWLGVTGPHDPNRNILPLGIWTVFWVGLVLLTGLVGTIWPWLNPWIGPYALARRLGLPRHLCYPRRLGHWPALAGFLAFAAVLLAHPAPTDPDRLAPMVVAYWAVQFAATCAFGPAWLHRGEVFGVLLAAYARLAAMGAGRIGLPGWRVVAQAPPNIGLAIFMIAMLAVGSFDGLNETFWWFGLVGLNPLEFPGRSAAIWSSLLGLALSLPALVAVYAATIWAGGRLAAGHVSLGAAFRAFAPSLLPIAFAYHFAHYLTAALVDGQYVLRWLAEASGLGTWEVTTGFFKRLTTVRVIWLAQAGAVVAGHVLAILIAHVLALNLYGTTRRAALSQAPLALFMIGYTLFGLWLLASPRGL